MCIKHTVKYTFTIIYHEESYFKWRTTAPSNLQCNQQVFLRSYHPGLPLPVLHFCKTFHVANTESFKQQAAVPCFTRVTRRNSFIPLQSTDHLNRFSNNPLSFTKCPPYFHLLCSWGSHGNCYKLVLSLHKLPVQLLQIQLFLHAYSNSESKSYLRNAGSIATKRHNSN